MDGWIHFGSMQSRAVFHGMRFGLLRRSRPPTHAISLSSNGVRAGCSGVTASLSLSLNEHHPCFKLGWIHQAMMMNARPGGPTIPSSFECKKVDNTYQWVRD